MWKGMTTGNSPSSQHQPFGQTADALGDGQWRAAGGRPSERLHHGGAVLAPSWTGDVVALGFRNRRSWRRSLETPPDVAAKPNWTSRRHRALPRRPRCFYGSCSPVVEARLHGRGPTEGFLPFERLSDLRARGMLILVEGEEVKNDDNHSQWDHSWASD